MYKFRYTLFVITVSLVMRCSGQDIEDCDAEDSCKVSGYGCGDYNGCFHALHKPLRSDRGTVEFHAYVTPESIGVQHPHNVTYSVLYELESGEWGTVDGCCNLKPNATCMLRPRREGEWFYTMFDTNTDVYPHYKRCVEQILENVPFPWCVDDNSSLCLSFVNGSLMVENDNRVSFSKFERVEQNIFFFRASREYAGSGKWVDDLLKRDVEGMEFDEETKKVKVFGKQLQIEAETMETESPIRPMVEDLLRRNATCEMWCLFYRATNFGDDYAVSKKPICAIPWINEDYKDTCGSGWMPWQTAVVVVSCLALLGFLAIVVGCLRSRYRYCKPDPEEAKKDLPNETRGVITDDGGEAEKLVPAEKPDSLPVNLDTEKKESKDINMNDHRSNQDECDGRDKLIEEETRDRMDSGLVADVNEPPSIEPDYVGEKDESNGGYITKLADSGLGTISSGLSDVRGDCSSGTQYQAVEFDLGEPFNSSDDDDALRLPTLSVKQLLSHSIFPSDIETASLKSNEPHISLPMPDPVDAFAFTEHTLDEGLSDVIVVDGYLEKDNAPDVLVDAYVTKDDTPGVDLLQRESLSSCDTGCDVNSLEEDANDLKFLITPVSSLPEYIQKEAVPDESMPIIGAVASDSPFVGYMPK